MLLSSLHSLEMKFLLAEVVPGLVRWRCKDDHWV